MAVNLETVKVHLSKGSETLIKVAAVVAAVTAIAGAYSFYLNNFWQPKVEVLSVDFSQGIAKVKVGNNILDIYGDAAFAVSNNADWAIKFGTSKIDGVSIYDRLELIKKLVVVEYLPSPKKV